MWSCGGDRVQGGRGRHQLLVVSEILLLPGQRRGRQGTDCASRLAMAEDTVSTALAGIAVYRQMLTNLQADRKIEALH